MMFVEVIFNIALNHAYSYHIPAELRTEICRGKRVLAPFGRRILTGVVTSVSSQAKFDNCKDIIDVLDTEPLVTDELLHLTKWMAEYYLSSWGYAINLALPKGLDESSKQKVYLYDTDEKVINQLTERQRILYSIIERAPGNTKKYYQKKFGEGAFHYLLAKLTEKGCIEIREERSKAQVQVLKRKFVVVPENHVEVNGTDQELFEKIRAYHGQAVLQSEFIRQLNLSTYRVNKLAENGLIKIEKREVHREAEFEFQMIHKDIVLSDEQIQALAQINRDINKDAFKVHLLHGVTGSGKTQVYLEAIKNVVDKGKSAIALIPEISLTPQTVRRFQEYFPGKIAVFHSNMSLGERYDAWRRINSGELKIVVGPRSALFMPLRNLGIIIVDEEHDSSYKQNESQPRYHARDVATYRAKLNDAVVVLGSATPSLETFYNTERKKYNLINLKNRVTSFPLPEVKLVDMRGKGKVAGPQKVFSKNLLDGIEVRLNKSEQVILLQNRRGFSSFLQCAECGFITRCPNCEITLTYHAYNNKLMCHYCNYSRPAGDTCPNCQGVQIKYKGSGTQKVEQELKTHFPQAGILRMDYDTTTGKGAHDRILESFRRREADILLGTQMIAKGLDFENVTLVGVISADIGLSLPDYSASERVFQLLTQVAGRSGRGEQAGEVIVQTYQIAHFAVQLARKHDYSGFYKQEIKNRQELSYPPISRMINIKIIGPDLNKTIGLAREIAQLLRRHAKGNYQSVGPAPAPISKINNLYRWHILLKINKLNDRNGYNTKTLLRKHLNKYLTRRLGEQRIMVDVDPVDMM